jgi:hypothetical protein
VVLAPAELARHRDQVFRDQIAARAQSTAMRLPSWSTSTVSTVSPAAFSHSTGAARLKVTSMRTRPVKWVSFGSMASCTS